jgi:hypothetical protein
MGWERPGEARRRLESSSLLLGAWWDDGRPWVGVGRSVGEVEGQTTINVVWPRVGRSLGGLRMLGGRWGRVAAPATLAVTW